MFFIDVVNGEIINLEQQQLNLFFSKWQPNLKNL